MHAPDASAPYPRSRADVVRTETLGVPQAAAHTEAGPLHGMDPWARSRAICAQPQVSIWDIPVRGSGPCCYRKCEARNKHCRAKLMEAFKAGIERSWERARSFRDDDAAEAEEEDAVEP